ncbi:glucose inhibited division protein B [Neisseria shayeganii 871]|uniref:Glucose inhibited division protein B n=1 Tax=Neisseria shayeganii 871 TaxID=1032488 RepID=G4CK51_9NEIS|nr:glucose inhibited division protein B [Neisseria shayeganii 871]
MRRRWGFCKGLRLPENVRHGQNPTGRGPVQNTTAAPPYPHQPNT